MDDSKRPFGVREEGLSCARGRKLRIPKEKMTGPKPMSTGHLHTFREGRLDVFESPLCGHQVDVTCARRQKLQIPKEKMTCPKARNRIATGHFHTFREGRLDVFKQHLCEPKVDVSCARSQESQTPKEKTTGPNAKTGSRPGSSQFSGKEL